jgi:Domain of unknown function (DUF4139)/N-terminal domain of unknown function (DUF4140)
MSATFLLAGALACAQLVASAQQAARTPERNSQPQAENGPAIRPAASKIIEVTIYQGRALVTREVNVPEGEGTLELLVSPLPPQVEDASLYAEGTDGVRVLSTRFRTRAVKTDTRKEVRAKQELVSKLQTDAKRLDKEIKLQQDDLKFLDKLGGFTGTALTGLTDKGRLDSEPIIALSKFIMETRSAKTKAEVELQRQLEANNETAEFTARQLTELSAGTSRVERDAVIVVQKSRPQPGTVRLGYLVTAASWVPQYRLRGGAADAPVRLEYLASVVQQTGESWLGVRVTLSTARPSLDAAPPELIPLKLAVAGGGETGPTDAHDDRSQKVLTELNKPLSMSFNEDTPLEDALKYVKHSTRSPAFPDGLPMYVDPVGLAEADKTMVSSVRNIALEGIPLKTTLKLILSQIDMTYVVRDGVLTITSNESAGRDDDESLDHVTLTGELPGMGRGLDEAWGAGAAKLNLAAASDQASELRVESGQGVDSGATDRAAPSVTFAVAGRLDLPSRKDPQLLGVVRLDMPAEYYAKAVPVMAPRVYRLAKLTNKSEVVLLPGEATVYVGTDFVGRMRLPLVAAGEPFVAGFGVDPQLQVSRRLVHKSRSVQGGNQLFDYEFRIGLRNYRGNPVKVQLWDRLPKPEGEAVAVNLVKTSVELSKDASYLRTARMDNLLRWDLDIPPGTIGDKTMYLNYEFRMEYARDLPQPRFVSGGLREGPIGGGAMGGLGGMGGGMK